MTLFNLAFLLEEAGLLVFFLGTNEMKDPDISEGFFLLEMLFSDGWEFNWENCISGTLPLCYRPLGVVT